jgi:5'-nucleotidase
MVTIYLDKDGVLADFDAHVERLFGAGPRQLGDAKLWECVEATPDFWETMPVKAGAHELFAIAAPYKPIILTGCPKTGYERASEHKPIWINKNFGPGIEVITCLSKDKPLHMKRPKDILVDDFIVNIKRWQKAGGRTVWYQTADQAIEDLKRKIERAIARELEA